MKNEITFKSENGECPYFIHKKLRFYISEKDGKYFLCVRDTSKDIELHFQSVEEAEDFLNNQGAHKYDSDNSNVYYKNNFYNFGLKGKEIIGRHKAEELSNKYENYLDCLKKSKQIVEEYLKENDSYQLSLLK